jgi:hypothetical protein
MRRQLITVPSPHNTGEVFMPSRPLALSDEQVTTIMQLARPLSPDQRTAFLELLAAKLNGQRELGDGALYRLCRETQREFFDPPNLGRMAGTSKYR